ncbi:MAG: hypothetical protein PVF91_03830 [Chromatiales bacterium]|jgi:hypothetical protein
MRALVLALAIAGLAGCSGDPEPEVTDNPVWGPGIQARRSAAEVADFANEQLRAQEEAIRRSGAAPGQAR